MKNFALFTAFLLIAASSAIAQVDGATLRSKYGAPLDREIFMVRPGIEMTVDYGPTKKACQMRFVVESVSSESIRARIKKQMDNLVGTFPPLSPEENAKLSAQLQDIGPSSAGPITDQETEQIEQIIDELVPPSIRGKELSREKMMTGGQGSFFRDHENVTIWETFSNATGIKITFKDTECAKAPAQ